jgi:predicted O-methyltransferase YrrM
MTTQTAMNNADEVLREIEAASEKNFLPIIGPFKGKYLVEEVRKAKPVRVLEVGTLIGYSAILMGKEMQDKSEIVTIEIHRDEAELAEKNILRANIPAKIKIITGDALEVIPTLEGQFDFAFIDADKNEYFQYLKLIENKLQRNSVIFADNAGIFADQMGDYLDYVSNSSKYRSRYIPVGGDGVEVSIKL